MSTCISLLAVLSIAERKVTVHRSVSPRKVKDYTRARICKRLWRPEIDSDESIPAAYVAWRAGSTNRAAVPARQAGNRFRGSLQGLKIRT